MLQRGWTPLHEAASEGQCETVDTLVMAGATVDVTNDVSCSNYIGLVVVTSTLSSNASQSVGLHSKSYLPTILLNSVLN